MKFKMLGVFTVAGFVGYAIGTYGARAQEGFYGPAADVETTATARPRVIAAAGYRHAMPAQARETQSELGGGFIEMLMTGRDPTPRRGAVIYNRPDMQAMPRRAYLAAPDPMLQDDAQDWAEPAAPRRRMALAPQPGMDAGPIQRMIDPRYEKQVVDYRGPHKAGTIVIDTSSKYLYLVQGGGTALRYGIGVGRPGFTWAGVKTVSMKREWPDWRPPSEMLRRRPDLPRHMVGGPANPLGARALYLGSSLYRIHGTNEPHTIGTNVSSGCIRMTNDNVIDLYKRVGVGARVVVM